METSLHRQLKGLYAGSAALTEQRLGKYRIDAVREGELIEVQHGSLGAIRDKIRKLLVKHQVLVVKPLVARKTLIRRSHAGGPEVSRRQSPKTATILSLFEELVYFTQVFPHANLTIETLLVEVEEWRVPGHGRRRRWRKNDFIVEDQYLVEVLATQQFKTCADLLALLPSNLPQPFHTGDLAAALGVRRPIAQRIAYCLRKTGAAEECGKAGNALLYRFAPAAMAKAIAKKPRRKRA